MPNHPPAEEPVVAAPELTPREEQEVEERTQVRAHVVHEAVRRDGDTEFERPASALATSGLAAGLSTGFSLIGEGILRSRGAVSRIGYLTHYMLPVLVGNTVRGVSLVAVVNHAQVIAGAAAHPH